MTAEKFHDAISLLPSDLIAEADEFRRGRPRVIPWTRYAAMAACFALVLFCARFASLILAPKGTMETAADYSAAAPMEQAAEAPAQEEIEQNSITGGSGGEDAVCDAAPAEPEARSPFVSHAVQTPLKPTTGCFTNTQLLITSREELEAYLTDKDWIYDFTSMTEFCTGYDGTWFEAHDLLLMTVHAAEMDFPFAVTDIASTDGTDPKGWDWYVFFTTPGEAYPEGEVTTIHLLTELEKGLITPEDSILAVADPVS